MYLTTLKSFLIKLEFNDSLFAHELNSMVMLLQNEQFHFYIKVQNLGAGKMAQQLRALAVLPEVISSIPSNHMVSQLSVMRSGALFWSAGICAGRTLYT